MSLIKCVKIPEELVKVGGIFRKNGFKAYLVGGAVRDMILGKKGHDYDLATNATPKQVMGIFKKVIPTGIAHGTVTIHIFGMQIETTTFRTEADYTDGRHPDSVKFATTIEEDLSRRDFTMNAIAADLESGELTDPFDGQKDIENKIIRTVGEPQERFGEDGLRPVRAVRFSSQLGFSIEEKTLAALSEPEVLKKTASISVERFRDEFCKMLLCERPSDSLKLLEKTGILNIFIPEFAICRNCSQKDSRGFHEFDVADHILYACDGAQKGNLEVKLAAFYHDIGKPECRTTEIVDREERVHFHGHETKSAQKALASMTTLKFPNETIKNVVHLVQEHMFYYEHSWSDAAVRRFIIRVKPENIENLFGLRLADIYGMHRTPLKEGSPAWNILLEFRKRIESVLEKKSALGIKDLAVNGRDLMQEGIPSGKTMGMILNELFETVTESPAMNEKEKLLTLAKNIFREKFRA